MGENDETIKHVNKILWLCLYYSCKICINRTLYKLNLK
jgi:hypothetical protein